MIPYSPKKLQQTCLDLEQPYGQDSDWHKAITKSTGMFIVADMMPFSIVVIDGFNLVKVLELCYKIPSHLYFSDKVVPELLEKEKIKVMEELSEASSVALTIDGWTFRTTESYVSVTEHCITKKWELQSPVLQVHPLFESHTTTNLAQAVTAAVDEWKLERPNSNIPVTTDNAKNQVNAVKEAGLGPCIPCFAHVINLASQKGISVNQMDRLVWKIKKVVSFFLFFFNSCSSVEN